LIDANVISKKEIYRLLVLCIESMIYRTDKLCKYCRLGQTHLQHVRFRWRWRNN